MENLEKCFFCGGKHEHMAVFGGSSRCMHWETVCDIYGAVAISEKAIDKISKNSLLRVQIQNLLREKSIKDRLELNIASNIISSGEIKNKLLEKMILIVSDKEDLRTKSPYPQYTLEQMLRNYPVTITDKLNRAIGNIGRLQSLPRADALIQVDSACLFVETTAQFSYFADMLAKSGRCNDAQLLRSDTPSALISLTVFGWEKFEEYEKKKHESNLAFIAMWFHGITKQYRNAVEDALDSTGYEPIIIDTYEHNNFIMDEVINKINEARFVIADFTCLPEQPEKDGKIPGGVRGGVYFEAGYARGLGKEVIVTCSDSDDAKKRRHFDIDQLNTLFWHDNDGKLYCGKMDFVQRLAERIKATVGRGNLN